jgi:hypothetical protein
MTLLFKVKKLESMYIIYITDEIRYVITEQELQKKQKELKNKIFLKIQSSIENFKKKSKSKFKFNNKELSCLDKRIKAETNIYSANFFKNQIIEYKKKHPKTQSFDNFLLHDFPENFSKVRKENHEEKLELYVDSRFTGKPYKDMLEIYNSTNEVNTYKIHPTNIIINEKEYKLTETYPVRYDEKQLIIYKLYYDYYINLYNIISDIDIQNNEVLNVKNLPTLSKVETKVKIDGIIYRTLLNAPAYIYKAGIIKYTGVDGNCISEGTWSGNPVINFYQCSNSGINTYRFGTNITIANKNKDNDGFNHHMNNTKTNGKNKIIHEIRKFENNKKNIIVISLLGICNETVNCFLANSLAGFSKKAKVSLVEPSIVDYELKENENDIDFISLPLSSNIKMNIVKLFDYEKWKTQIPKNDLTQKFYDIIDLKDDESTFKSIVDIAYLYYEKYKDTHILAYHCKSGKDRTSLFDCIIQSTFYYINNEKIYNENFDKSLKYEIIKKLSTKFLLFGFLIAFYGTGFLGLKLDSNKSFSTYLLGEDLYNFYYANANMSSSSG